MKCFWRFFSCGCLSRVFSTLHSSSTMTYFLQDVVDGGVRFLKGRGQKLEVVLARHVFLYRIPLKLCLPSVAHPG